MWTGIYTVYKLGVQAKINDAIIMQYIIVHLNSLIYYTKINIKPVVGVLGCDIALGLNHILGHPPWAQVLYLYYNNYKYTISPSVEYPSCLQAT